MIKIGFTGTQGGMTSDQKKSFLSVWKMIEDEIGIIEEFHHGDCIGSDEQAHNFVAELGASIVIHPPDNDSKRAWCVGNWEEKPLSYLDRNTEIVKVCDVLIATPKEHKEVLRSGTWATIRRAKEYCKDSAIIFPDGICKGLNRAEQ